MLNLALYLAIAWSFASSIALLVPANSSSSGENLCKPAFRLISLAIICTAASLKGIPCILLSCNSLGVKVIFSIFIAFSLVIIAWSNLSANVSLKAVSFSFI